MSLLPMGGLKPMPNPWLAENYPAAPLTMGLTAESAGATLRYLREDQDAPPSAVINERLPRSMRSLDEELVPVAIAT